MRQQIIRQFHEGHCLDAHKVYGAHFEKENEQSGVRFSLFAPAAQRVQVSGSFNSWSEVDLNREEDGTWTLFIQGIQEWSLYKYKIQKNDGTWIEKTDPYAFASEVRPKVGNLVVDLSGFAWGDKTWINKRRKHFDEPMNIYELHLGSWMKRDGLFWMNYEELVHHLIPYVKDMGYTHIELMPLIEHPFDGSWGYQAHGYFSLTSRYGTPKQFMHLVNQCHINNIGVILDFVPVHFVKDDFGLRYFDGSALYEYPNEKDANSQWDTMNFDLGKEEVRSFMMSSASFWMETYHVDGFRVDAVSNLIYWHGNKSNGSNEGAVAFIRRLNYYLNVRYPGITMIAEDSSDFPKVTHPTTSSGLGFDYKWDMGWMNDTLRYYALDPIYRQFHHHQLTFSMAYFYSENFILPLSHDEVVHGKGTIINKMWGSYEQKFSQVRNLYLYMMTHPGKKLNFMGNELAQFKEFDEKVELDWFLMGFETHNKFHRYIRDLNHVYFYHSCLSKKDYAHKGFKWIDADNAAQSIYCYFREDEHSCIVVILNMTPNAFEHYRVGVPYPGLYTEIMNTEKDIYNGNNMCNYFPINSEDYPSHGFLQSINIRIAPFAGILFECRR